MKTYSPKPEHIERRWYVLDANGQVLGRLASEVATLLRGKHKPMFAPHMDTGDHVIVVNADKVELTGKKLEDKIAWRHSGYPGGITGVKYGDLMATRPVAAVEKAVRGMLPKNRIGRQMIKKLHIVGGPRAPARRAEAGAARGGGAPGVGRAARPSDRADPDEAEDLEAGVEARHARAAEASRRPSRRRSRSRPRRMSPKKRPMQHRSPPRRRSPPRSPPRRRRRPRSRPRRRTAAKKPTAKKTTAKKPTAKKTTAKKPPKSEE